MTWVARAKRVARQGSTSATYARLAEKPAQPVLPHSAVEPKLFDSIIAKYTHDHRMPAGRHGAGPEMDWPTLRQADLDALPLYSPIAAAAAVTVGGPCWSPGHHLAGLPGSTLWTDWFTSVDHKSASASCTSCWR